MPLPDSKFSIILRNVSRHITLTKNEAEVFRSLLSYRRIRRRQYVLQEGDVCRYENYVLSGCLRSYYTDRDGFEHVTMFAIEDWWISDLDSLLTQTPATLTIDALEDTEVLQIDPPSIEQLYEKVPKFERFFRILLQKAFVAHQRRILDIIARSAEERYEEFATRYPAFLQRIPQKHIAAYLGITPEFLSRIRRKRTRTAV
jgi:CRP-like cAMP-binding protein